MYYNLRIASESEAARLAGKLEEIEIGIRLGSLVANLAVGKAREIRQIVEISTISYGSSLNHGSLVEVA